MGRRAMFAKEPDQIPKPLMCTRCFGRTANLGALCLRCLTPGAPSPQNRNGHGYGRTRIGRLAGRLSQRMVAAMDEMASIQGTPNPSREAVSQLEVAVVALAESLTDMVAAKEAAAVN